jgi:hypothetical protein
MDDALESPGRGRPTKCTEELQKKFFDALSKGLPLKTAASLVGISEQTFRRWNRDDTEFAERVKRAEAQWIARHVDTINSASLQDWKASTWLLERRHADLFASPNVQLSQQINIANTHLGLTALEVQELFRRNQNQIDALLNGKTLELPDGQDQD